MRNLVGIKPQDVLVMMKLLASPDLSQRGLAEQLFISQAEVSHGLKRLKASSLLVDGHVSVQAALEFLVHGLKYICPPEFGMPALGLPTSFAHPEFKFVKYGADEVYVWPEAKGEKRGIALLPIYPTLPQACVIDKNLYRLAALVEMVRAGRARERQIGADEIKKFLKKPNDKKRHSS
jgi:hypothetical protein